MKHPDGVIEQTSKHLLSLSGYQFEPFLSNQIATANYTVPFINGHKEAKENDRSFYTNNSIWEAVMYEQIRRTDINIVLDGFFLFEWFPRSPGLFYTNKGRDARQEARNNIDSIRNGVIVYNPYGKLSMLDGGVGNLRLKPIEIKNREYCLMSASSNGICHEGFPVAVPIELYNQCIEEITDRGAVVRKLIGKLQYVPDSISSLYRGYIEVPQMYLRVEEVSLPNQLQSRHMEELWVSVAVSFLSDYEGSKKTYATYVHFDPTRRNSLRQSVEWMEQDYVIGRYKGKVITDFDEQKSNFASAPFSLNKIMNLSLVGAEICNFANDLHINANQILSHQAQIVLSIQEVNIMENKYNITGGNQGAVGDQAEAHNFTQVSNQTQGSIDMTTLATELYRLRMEAKKVAIEPEHDIAVSEIAKAEQAAKEGQESKVMEHLKSAGKWALDVATKIGTGIALEAIKKSTGL
jgi:hypothetical protein